MVFLFTQYHKKIFWLADAEGCTVRELKPNKYIAKGRQEIIDAGYGDTTFEIKEE